MSSILRIDELNVDFHLGTETVRAVRGVSLHVREGEILAVVGESGSGKTATAMSVLRLNPEPPCVYSGGRILLDGRDLLGHSERQMRSVRGADVAMIFQDPMTSLNPLKRVGAQLAEVLRVHQDVSRGAARAAVLPALREAGITDPQRRASQYPHQLSGGLRQRVMIAMALIGRPRLLIADEPTTALDVTVQARILRLLTELRESHGMAIMLITHDIGVVAEVADRVVVLNQGRAVETGHVLDVLTAPTDDHTRDLLRATPRLELS